MKRVLAIDGGGMRGIIPALICQHIERTTGRSVSSLFDLIAGTSTGGILALGLTNTTPMTSAQKIVDFYESKGPRIFSFPALITKLSPKYSNTRLEQALKEVLTDTLFCNVLTRVLCTAYDTRLRKPKIFDSGEASTLSKVQVALATSAAPTYFPPYKISTDRYLDGGVIANNPTAVAYSHAKQLWPEEEILLLSLGTGKLVHPLDQKAIGSWGEVQWARPVIDCFMDGSAQLIHDFFTKTSLSDNYLRLQGGLSELTEPMDATSQQSIDGLKVVADQILDGNRTVLSVFLKRLVEVHKTLRLRITSHRQLARVRLGPLALSGDCTNYRGQKIYAFTGKPGRFWPSECVVPDGIGRWHAGLNVGGIEGASFVTVAEVDEELASYIEFYRSVASDHSYCGMPLPKLPSVLAAVELLVKAGDNPAV